MMWRIRIASLLHDACNCRALVVAEGFHFMGDISLDNVTLVADAPRKAELHAAPPVSPPRAGPLRCHAGWKVTRGDTVIDVIGDEDDYDDDGDDADAHADDGNFRSWRRAPGDVATCSSNETHCVLLEVGSRDLTCRGRISPLDRAY